MLTPYIVLLCKKILFFDLKCLSIFKRVNNPAPLEFTASEWEAPVYSHDQSETFLFHFPSASSPVEKISLLFS